MQKYYEQVIVLERNSLYYAIDKLRVLYCTPLLMCILVIQRKVEALLYAQKSIACKCIKMVVRD